MKAVLISTQPKWCELIAKGEKTVEVRKSKPKLRVPFPVYIYCSKGTRKGDFITKSEKFGYITGHEGSFYNRATEYDANGKVIGEFVCDKIVPLVLKENGVYYIPAKEHCGRACMTVEEARKYGNGKPLYAWHISNLVIYDKPKYLSEFVRLRRCYEENINEWCAESCSEYLDGECDGK